MSESAKTRTNPYAAFDAEIADLVIKPKIKALFEAGEPINSLSALITKFKSEYGANVSAPTMKRWLDAAGIKLQRSVVFTGIED